MWLAESDFESLFHGSNSPRPTPKQFWDRPALGVVERAGNSKAYVFAFDEPTYKVVRAVTSSMPVVEVTHSTGCRRKSGR